MIVSDVHFIENFKSSKPKKEKKEVWGVQFDPFSVGFGLPK